MKEKELKRMEDLFDLDPDKRTPAQKKELDFLCDKWDEVKARQDHEWWVRQQPV